MELLPNVRLILILYWASHMFACQAPSLEQKAKKKIGQLKTLMAKADERSIDIKREETTLWFAEQFLKFANWDEEHKSQVEKAFGYDFFYKAEKERYANELPDFERQKVIEILDKGIHQVEEVLAGNIIRRPTPEIDWSNIEVTDEALLNKGKPIFLHDYFSKSVGIPLTNEDVYNDHLGNMYHGGEHLYEEHQDRAINSFILKEDGVFDEDKLKLLTNIPNTNIGFLYFWNSGLPNWMYERDSTIDWGRSLFLGFDIDNPMVRKHWGKIARKAGELTNGKKVTQLGFVLANEPHWFAEAGYWTQNYGEMNNISAYTLEKFRDWLSSTYQDDIEALNANWKSNFYNFQSVDITIPMDKKYRGQPMWYDWCRFSMARSLEWFTYIQNELRSTYPDAPTSIKLQTRYFLEDYRSHGLDFEALTELTSIIGDDAKAKTGRNLGEEKAEPWEDRYAYSWEEIAFSYDFMESVSPHKIHFNSEAHFLSLSRWKDLNNSADYVRSVFWLATLHGMDASTSWFWARDPDGSPEDRLEGELDFWDPGLGGAYAGSANMQPQTVNEVAQVMMDMNSVSKVLMALRTQRKPLRLFYSETSAINKKDHATQLFKLYESLYFEGIPLGYATEKIIKKQDHSSWDAILVHQTEYVEDREFEALQSYLNQGGTIIIDEQSLKMDQYGNTRQKTLKAGSGKIIPINDHTLASIRALSLEVVSDHLPVISIKESNGTAHKGCMWRVMEKEAGKYVLNILNLGKQSARITLKLKSDTAFSVTNMLTDHKLETEFQLKPFGVLLLEVKERIE